MAKSKTLRAIDTPDPWILPSPSIGLNRALNGGYYSGRIHTLYGPTASGKSTHVYHCIAEAQRMGKKCWYNDAEQTFLKSRAAACGVDLAELEICYEQKAEEILGEIIPKLRKKEVDVVVIDSLNSIFFEAYFDNSDYKGIGTGARSHNFVVGKILEAMDPFDHMIFLITHVTMAQSGQTMTQQAKLSKSVEHWTATLIKLRKDMSKQELNDETAKIYWRVDKSKTSSYPKEGDYVLSSGQDVSLDHYLELANIAVELGVVGQNGPSWLVLNDRKWQGVAKFAAAMEEDQELYEMILEAVTNGV